MKRILLLLILISSVCLAEDEYEVPETLWYESEKEFSCTPKSISVNGTINIKLGSNHFKELAVYRHSDKSWLFLVVGSPPKQMDSLMKSSSLKKAESLNINQLTTGFRWEKDGFNEKVFLKPGKYTIYNSDILESEYGGYKCEVIVQNN